MAELTIKNDTLNKGKFETRSYSEAMEIIAILNAKRIRFTFIYSGKNKYTIRFFGCQKKVLELILCSI